MTALIEFTMMGPVSAFKLKINARPVQSVQAVQIGRRIFATPYMAAKHEAWRMICARYVKDGTYPKGLLGVRELRGMTCSCWGRDPRHCKIHSHESGYFARLHKRLTRQLAAKYKLELSS